MVHWISKCKCTREPAHYHKHKFLLQAKTETCLFFVYVGGHAGCAMPLTMMNLVPSGPTLVGAEGLQSGYTRFVFSSGLMKNSTEHHLLKSAAHSANSPTGLNIQVEV